VAAPSAKRNWQHQGTVQRADMSPHAEAQITREGQTGRSQSRKALIQAVSTRGIIFNPKRLGTVDEGVARRNRSSGAKGQGPGITSVDEAPGRISGGEAPDSCEYVWMVT